MTSKSTLLLQRLSVPLSLALLTWTVAQQAAVAQQVASAESQPSLVSLSNSVNGQPTAGLTPDLGVDLAKQGAIANPQLTSAFDTADLGVEVSEPSAIPQPASPEATDAQPPLGEAQSQPTPMLPASNAATDLMPNNGDLFAQTGDPVLVAPPANNYIGVGGTFGDNSLGTILGKLSITRFGALGVSFRPAAAIGRDGANFRLPVTLETRFNSPEGDQVLNSFIPFAGAGIAINTGQDDDNGDDDGNETNGTNVNAMLTLGTDYLLAPRITATAALNVIFVRDSSLEGVVGLGYSF